MNLRLTGNFLGKILLLECAAMVPSLILSICETNWSSVTAFLITMAALSAFGGILSLTKAKKQKLYAREGFVIVALSWILISLFGALPYTISGYIPSYVDSLFETVSGFTTTGSSILSDIEALPMGLLLWRSITIWLGGMGVLVFILALAPRGNGNGMNLHIMKAESPGPVVGKIAPKLHSTARILYSMYIALTILEFIFLICGGMPLFDSVNTALSTAGTGGFSIRNAGIAAYSAYSQVVIAIFMMLFGVNFSIYYLLLIRDFRSIWKNGEVKVYFSIVIIATAVVAFNTASLFSNAGETIRHSFFQVNAIITTTGFSTVDFNMWPVFSQTILVGLMFIGGCAGSTAGGLKVTRVIILLKSFKNEVRRMLHPQCVTTVKVDGKPIDDDTVNQVGIYFAIYIFIMILSVLVLSIAGHSFTTNVTSVISCLNNIGPGLDEVGPVCNYGFFPAYGKVVLIVDMLLGRLELFPLLMLFSPSVWKRI